MITFAEYLQQKDIFEAKNTKDIIIGLQRLIQAYKKAGHDLRLSDVQNMMKTGGYGFEDFIKWATAENHSDNVPVSYLLSFYSAANYKPMTPQEMQQAKADLNKLNIR